MLHHLTANELLGSSNAYSQYSSVCTMIVLNSARLVDVAAMNVCDHRNLCEKFAAGAILVTDGRSFLYELLISFVRFARSLATPSRL